MSRHVLVFGGTGRLGPAVTLALSATWPVSEFSRRSDVKMASTRLTHIPCDVRIDSQVRDAVRRVLYGEVPVAHDLGLVYMSTAGMDSGSGSGIGVEYELAVKGFSSVVDAVADSNRAWRSVSVVFMSSVAVESKPPGAKHYVLGKAAGEALCSYYAKYPPASNWRFNTLRVGRVSRSMQLKRSVSRLTCFLVGEESMGISGQTFTATSPSLESG